jgi:hypothetical protein
METRQTKVPSDAEIEQLRKAVNEVTADFFAAYGEKYQFILSGRKVRVRRRS